MRIVGSARQALVTAAAFIGAGLAGVATAIGAPLVVGNCLGASPYATIQSAVNAASAGSTVLVCPGEYPEQVTITKALTLEGTAASNADAAIILPPAGGMTTNAISLSTGDTYAAQLFVHDTRSVTLTNLTVDGTGNQLNGCSPNLIGVLFQNASGIVKEIVTRNQALAPADNDCQSGLGIYVESGVENSVSGTSVVTVSNSSVHDYQKNGITGANTGTAVTITGDAVRGQGLTTGAAENGIQVGDGATGSITSNDIADEIYADPASAGASGILIVASSGIHVLTILSATRSTGSRSHPIRWQAPRIQRSCKAIRSSAP